MINFHQFAVLKQWVDEHLTWTPINFGGLTEIRLNPQEIWKPDVLLYNGADLTKATSYAAATNAIAYSNGNIIWVPPITVKSLCDANTRHYPHDTQTCNLTFGSWTFQSQLVNISAPEGNLLIQMDEFPQEIVKNGPWELVGNTTTRLDRIYSCCKGQIYPTNTLTLTLKRRNPAHCYTVVLPQAASLLLALLTFWIPGKKGLKNRILLAIVAISLSYASINYMLSDIGSTASGVPIAGK